MPHQLLKNWQRWRKKLKLKANFSDAERISSLVQERRGCMRLRCLLHRNVRRNLKCSWDLIIYILYGLRSRLNAERMDYAPDSVLSTVRRWKQRNEGKNNERTSFELQGLLWMKWRACISCEWGRSKWYDMMTINNFLHDVLLSFGVSET